MPPIGSDGVSDETGTEEEEPTLEASWPHTQIVYEFEEGQSKLHQTL